MSDATKRTPLSVIGWMLVVAGFGLAIFGGDLFAQAMTGGIVAGIAGLVLIAKQAQQKE